VSEWPESAGVDRFLRRARRRLLLLHGLEGAAAGIMSAWLLLFIGIRPTSVTLGVFAAAVAATVALRVAFGERSLAGIARIVERRAPHCRNLVVTAAEVLQKPNERTRVRDLVVARAAELVRDLDASRLYPVRNAGLAAAVAGLALIARVLGPDAGVAIRHIMPASGDGPSIRRVEVTVIPPSYSGIARSTVTNPSRIEALAASRIELRVDAAATSVDLGTLNGVSAMDRAGGAFTAALSAAADGFIAIEPRDSAGIAGPRYLVGLTVTPDRSPTVTLTSPGRDLFFSTVPGAIPVAINADDDLGLLSVRLRYTAVSGSGERFTFVERDVPVAVTATNARSWNARGTWRLDQLDLAPGDLIVYRAIAADRRPGAPPVESESYVVEMVTPGAIAAEGFAADDRRDRYAVSQQMVILKTERLVARRGSLAADSLTEEARLLAAEQRSVRAEFVFMMGGELEDAAAELSGTLDVNEVAEAESEGDLLAGRLQNQGRVDMMRAIRAMSRASAALTDANLDQALRDERTALQNLMRAFSRSRFILRALTQRERIDLQRRLTGTLVLTQGLSGPATRPEPDERSIALRRLLASVAAMASRDSSAAAAERASLAAIALLRAAAGSDTLRQLALAVQDLATQVQRGAVSDVRSRVDTLLTRLSSATAASVQVAPRTNASLQSDLLGGALRDALGSRGRRP